MIAAVTVSLLAAAGFAFALGRVRLVPVARGAMQATTTGLGALTNSDLDDDAKEIAVRRAGFRLIGSAFGLFWRIGLALLAASAPIFVADITGIAARDAVFAMMLRWDFLLIVTAFAIVLYEILRRLRVHRDTAEQAETEGANRYSGTDQIVHMLAFSSPVVLRAASALEDRLVRRMPRDPETRPVFVTSLARGGTTAVLNALNDAPEIAAHTYRDMPFVTAPALWDRVAGGKKRGVERHQRAHGDGLEIDLDTPEAFEEVIWKMFWPEKFQGNTIALWTGQDHKPDAERFLARQMAKVVHVRQGDAPRSRYCSKNNGNIARIPFLLETFPDCQIVVPVRRPECHAASLLRQHENFLELQTKDDFIRRYMADIGHFEFGRIHKPIEFDGFDPDRFDAATGDYWLHYWTQAFREVLKHRDRCRIVFQDDLRAKPAATMLDLCKELHVTADAIPFKDHFRTSPDRASKDLFSKAQLAEAMDVYATLNRPARGDA